MFKQLYMHIAWIQSHTIGNISYLNQIWSKKKKKKGHQEDQSDQTTHANSHYLME